MQAVKQARPYWQYGHNDAVMHPRPDQAPEIRMETKLIGQRSPGGPREIETPEGIDPGFGYAPGRDAWLKEQASRALRQEDVAFDERDWRPIITRGPDDYGRPAIVPVSPAPAQLLPRPATQRALQDALQQVIGGERKVFDVKGLPLLVDRRSWSTTSQTIWIAASTCPGCPICWRTRSRCGCSWNGMR